RAPLGAAAMKRTADVVVVGGGVIGCAIARDLARRGVHTIVVERAEVGGEATRAAAGMVAPQAESTRPGPLLRLGIASRARYGEWTEALVAESGIDVEYRTDGIVDVALTAADARVLAAAGAWAAALGLPPGVPSPPVVPVRGQVLVLRGGLDTIPRPLYSLRGYVVPRVDGRVLAGSTLEDAGYEKRVTAGAAADILAAACAMAPALSGMTLETAYAGLRPATPDPRPILGPAPGPAGPLYATGRHRR